MGIAGSQPSIAPTGIEIGDHLTHVRPWYRLQLHLLELKWTSSRRSITGARGPLQLHLLELKYDVTKWAEEPWFNLQLHLLELKFGIRSSSESVYFSFNCTYWN